MALNESTYQMRIKRKSSGYHLNIMSSKVMLYQISTMFLFQTKLKAASSEYEDKRLHNLEQNEEMVNTQSIIQICSSSLKADRVGLAQSVACPPLAR